MKQSFLKGKYLQWANAQINVIHVGFLFFSLSFFFFFFFVLILLTTDPFTVYVHDFVFEFYGYTIISAILLGEKLL